MRHPHETCWKYNDYTLKFLYARNMKTMYVTDNEAVREYFTFTYTDKETEIIRKIRIYYFFF